MSNKERKYWSGEIHLYLAILRPKYNDGKPSECIRKVIKDRPDHDLKILEAQCQALGGEWRIHHTVNARDPQKAWKNLMILLLNHPEKASHLDTAWRTELLRPSCILGRKRFLLDVDTEMSIDVANVEHFIEMSNGEIEMKIKSPSGWHFVTNRFDARKVCELSYVTILRDGYYYVKTVKG